LIEPLAPNARYLASARQARQAEAAHHLFDGVPSDRQMSTQDDFLVDPPSTASLARLVTQLADHLGDHCVAHRTG
jgi:hypothetical protein